MSLARWLMDKLGPRLGIAADFALVTLCAWLLYPLPWYWLAGVVAYYAYWMALQVEQVRRARPN